MLLVIDIHLALIEGAGVKVEVEFESDSMTIVLPLIRKQHNKHMCSHTNETIIACPHNNVALWQLSI